MKDGYVEAAWYALLAVLVVTFLALRRVGDALLAVLPTVFGGEVIQEVFAYSEITT